MLSFSIVINTLNRASLLQKTLESFRWLDYSGEFEVIVVNGPSTDHTAQIIRSWLPRIRVGSCDVANLSVSRNVGICMARGDIVAFIDDDAVPEPEWLTQLAAGYDKAEVGGAGGIVFDRSGCTYQYQYSTANRLGNANWASKSSTEHMCFPGSYMFPYLQGTNASFRRSVLLEVGGFDEEIEFYLDETELCCRIIDAGYVIRQLPNAYVHHKFASSHVRDENKITRFRYPVLKNKIYFSLKHARPYLQIQEILEDNRKFIQGHADEVESFIRSGRLPETERARFEEESKLAWLRGNERGLSWQPERPTGETLSSVEAQFIPLISSLGINRKSIVLISRDFPTLQSEGTAAIAENFAQALADKGNIVHLITQSSDINRVDFECGVWVHRVLQRNIPMPPSALERQVPTRIWDWSATALEECRRISTHRPVNVVEAPLWECEGIAFLLEGNWPLVTSLTGGLHSWMCAHPNEASDGEWMSTFGIPVLALERELMTSVAAIRAENDPAALKMESSYDLKLDRARTQIIPHDVSEAERCLELYEVAVQRYRNAP